MESVSIDTSKNFIITIFENATAIQTTIKVTGDHNTYTGYINIRDEVMYVNSASYVTDHTEFVVTRGYFNTEASAYTVASADNIYSTHLLNTESYNYKKILEYGSSDLFGVNLSEGYLKLNDNPILWSPTDSNRIYNYKAYKRVFIYEYESDETYCLKQYEGATYGLRRDSFSKTVTINFKDPFIKKYDSSVGQVRFFYNNTIKEVLETLYPEYTVIPTGGLAISDFITLKNLNTREFDKSKDLLNAIAKRTATRMYFATNNEIYIITGLDPALLTPQYNIQRDIMDIDGSEDNYIKINKIESQYKERFTWKDINDYKTSADKTIYFGSSVFKDPATVTTENLQVILDGSYKEVVLTLESQYVNYNDTICVVDNLTGLEYFGKVTDINGTSITVIFGIDKFFNWINKGRLTDITGTDVVADQDKLLTDYKVVYPIVEVPLVWKYARSVGDEDKDSNIRYPLIPRITLVTTGTNATVGTKVITTSGTTFTTTFVKGDVVYLGYEEYTISVIDSDTQLTVYESIITTVSNGALYLDDGRDVIQGSFAFADDGEKKYSGLISEIEGIWDTQLTKTELLCGKEYQQGFIENGGNQVPIYAYTNKLGVQGTPEETTYSTFDNEDFELNMVRSENTDNDFKLSMYNVMSIADSTIERMTPIGVIGRYIYLNITDYGNINAGDVLKLNRATDDNTKAIYENNREFKWSVYIKETEISDSYSNVTVTSSSPIVTWVSGFTFDTMFIGDTVEINSVTYTILSIESNIGMTLTTNVTTGITADLNLTRYAVLVDSFYPNTVDSINLEYMEFKLHPYQYIIHLNELYIRGMPIMEVDKPQQFSNAESIAIYGEMLHKLDTNFASPDDYKIIVDHLNNSYASTTTANSRSRIKFQKKGMENVKMLDVCTVSDSIYTGFNGQKAIITGLEVTNTQGKKTVKVEALTVGDYTASSNGIRLATQHSWSPQIIPVYSHIGGEGTTKQAEKINTPIISLEDETLGTVFLKEYTKAELTATAVNSSWSPVTKALTISCDNIIDVTGMDRKHMKAIFTVGNTFFIQMSGEYVQVKSNSDWETWVNPATTFSFQVTKRGCFGSSNSSGRESNVISFLRVSAKNTDNGFETTELEAGNKVDNIVKVNDIDGVIVETINGHIKLNRDLTATTHYRQQIGSNLSDTVDANYSGFFFGDPTLTNENYLKYNQGSDLQSLEFEGKYFNKVAYCKSTLDFVGALDASLHTILLSSISYNNPFFGKKVNYIVLTSVNLYDFTLLDDRHFGYVSSNIAGTGTMSMTSGSVTITGLNTLFTTELSVGSKFVVSNISLVEYTIATIVNNTSATMTTTLPATASGLNFTILKRISVTSGGSTITGTNTLFDTELDTGTRVNIAGELYTIATVTNDTSATIVGTFSSTETGIEYSLTDYVIPSSDIYSISSLQGSTQANIDIEDRGLILDSQIKISDVRFKNLGSVNMIDGENFGAYITAQGVSMEDVRLENLVYGINGNFKVQQRFSSVILESYDPDLPFGFRGCTNMISSSVVIGSSFNAPDDSSFYESCNNMYGTIVLFDTSDTLYDVVLFKGSGNIVNTYIATGALRQIALASYNIDNMYYYITSAISTNTKYLFQSCNNTTNITTAGATNYDKFFLDSGYITNCNSTEDPTQNSGIAKDTNNSWNYKFITKIANSTLTTQEDNVNVSVIGVAITLPTVLQNEGRVYTICNTSAGNITINTTTKATGVMSRYIYNGTSWYLI